MVNTVTYRSLLSNPEQPTDDDLIKILKNEHQCSYSSDDDHPEFKKLRANLGEKCYIAIQRGWWNGDIVVKPFKLNGVLFRKGSSFHCGDALAYTLKGTFNYKERHKGNTE
jgi:hypothetical protein